MRAMLALALVVLSTVGATKSTARAGQQQCAWGAGEAVPQEGGAPGHNFTCTPPAIVGAGHTTLEVAESALGEDVYLDAQLFTYHPKPAPRGDGVVKVALLSMGGADGKSNLSTSLRYVAKAGELRADLCVLPENFAQKHVGKVGDMNPPPQPVSGPIISAVSALARKYSMNIVAPIREQRGRLVLNTAVVIARNGSVRADTRASTRARAALRELTRRGASSRRGRTPHCRAWWVRAAGGGALLEALPRAGAAGLPQRHGRRRRGTSLPQRVRCAPPPATPPHRHGVRARRRSPPTPLHHAPCAAGRRRGRRPRLWAHQPRDLL